MDSSASSFDFGRLADSTLDEPIVFSVREKSDQITDRERVEAVLAFTNWITKGLEDSFKPWGV